MKVEKDKIRISFNQYEEDIIEEIIPVFQHIYDTMKYHDCNIMLNEDTGECILLRDFGRVLGILSGLTEMTEILFDEREQNNEANRWYYDDTRETKTNDWRHCECEYYDDCEECQELHSGDCYCDLFDDCDECRACYEG